MVRNVGFSPGNGETGTLLPCVFDPTFYYSHSEADLGIISMFSSFSDDFFRAYHDVIPKQPDT